MSRDSSFVLCLWELFSYKECTYAANANSWKSGLANVVTSGVTKPVPPDPGLANHFTRQPGCRRQMSSTDGGDAISRLARTRVSPEALLSCR